MHMFLSQLNGSGGEAKHHGMGRIRPVIYCTPPPEVWAPICLPRSCKREIRGPKAVPQVDDYPYGARATYLSLVHAENAEAHAFGREDFAGRPLIATQEGVGLWHSDGSCHHQRFPLLQSPGCDVFPMVTRLHEHILHHAMLIAAALIVLVSDDASRTRAAEHVLAAYPPLFRID